MCGDVQAVGCAVRGASHQRQGREGQDAIYWQQRQGALALAVADGHSKAPKGLRGADLAVQVAVEQLLNFDDALTHAARTRPGLVRELTLRPFGRQLVQAWRDLVFSDSDLGRSEALRDNVLQDHGTTLAATLVTDHFVLALQIGDGDVLWVDSFGVQRPLDDDPFAFADVTPSLCGPQAWEWLRAKAWPRQEEEALIAVMTDGYVNSYPDDLAIDDVVSGYLELIRGKGLETVDDELPSFLEQVTRRGSGDDVTLGLVHLPPNSARRTVPREEGEHA